MLNPPKKRRIVFQQRKRGNASRAQRRRILNQAAMKNKDDPITVTESNLGMEVCDPEIPFPSQDEAIDYSYSSTSIGLPEDEEICNSKSTNPVGLPDSLMTDELYISCPETPDSHSLPDLIIEPKNSVPTPSLPSERVICNIGHVIAQARKLEEHNYKCNFNGTLIYSSVLKHGLEHTYTFVCDQTLCGHKETLVTDLKEGCLNKLAVFGAMSVGSGFYLEEQKFSFMNMSYMSQNTYNAAQKVTGSVIEKHSTDIMNAYIDEEKRLAKERGDVDKDDFHYICVIEDGGWCKRSYGHGYNASSGVAVIIGAVTKKILYISVRNKVCLICQHIEKERIPPRDHACSKNWKGPSTAMESDIIVEGLKYLEEVHKIRCTRIIGDGDTNLMKKVQENVSFGGRVMKVECANHAVRRYLKALQKMQKDTSKFKGHSGVKARKILLQRMSRLVMGARVAITKNSVPNLHEATQDKVSKLANELINGPAHVFGKHDSCSDFCKRRESDPDASVYQTMNDTGMFHAIKEEIRRVFLSCCSTLIFNLTNNPAENYMSQFCKTIGGKRVDFSKGTSIKRRAHIAAVAFQNPAQKWQYNANKVLTGRSPGTSHRKFIARRWDKHVKTVNRKKLFVPARRKKEHITRGGDENYGDQPDVPDLDISSLQQKIREHMSSIAVDTREEFEEATRMQSSCEKWREERCKRIPSSMFKDVALRRPTTLCAKLVKRIIYHENISAKAIEYGKANEPVALEKYEKEKNVKVQRCGLFVDPEFPFLCTTPDGLIGGDGLIEVKCPFLAKNSSSLMEVVLRNGKIGLNCKDGKLYLPSSHKYYYQIQGQLAITKRKWCDLFVWSPQDTTICRIQRDDEFWDKIVPKLQQFYTECCVPEIVDPRVTRKQPIREPHYILEAIKQKDDKKIATKRKKAIPSKMPNKNVDQTAGSSGRESACQEFIGGEYVNEIEELSHPTELQANDPVASCSSSRPKRAKKPKVIFDM